jgi:hypothetical protein
MVALPGGIPRSIVRAISCPNISYPDPTGSERADCVPLAEEITKGWFQNFQESPRRDVFRSIPCKWTFEKGQGTSSVEPNGIITDQCPGSGPDGHGITIWNIASTCIIRPSKLGSQTEAIRKILVKGVRERVISLQTRPWAAKARTRRRKDPGYRDSTQKFGTSGTLRLDTQANALSPTEGTR